MFDSRFSFVVVTLSVALAAFLHAKSLHAAESNAEDQSAASQPSPVSGADIVQPSEARPPKSPLRLSTVDYEDAGEGAGKLKVAGIALPGKELYLFLDDQPLAKVVPDDGGKWSIESDLKLGDGRHTLRADQYDETTQMLAARAMVSIERAKAGEATPGQAAPTEAPPKETTP
jgi:hypothetical protein